MLRRHRHTLAALATLAACASSPAAPQNPAPADGAVARLDASTAVDAPAPVDAPTVADVAVVDAPDVTAPAEDVPMTAGEYPEGPYGNREGDVLANLAWQGYVNTSGEEVSSALPFGDTSLQALRGSGRGYALLQVSEFL